APRMSTPSRNRGGSGGGGGGGSLIGTCANRRRVVWLGRTIASSSAPSLPANDRARPPDRRQPDVPPVQPDPGSGWLDVDLDRHAHSLSKLVEQDHQRRQHP